MFILFGVQICQRELACAFRSLEFVVNFGIEMYFSILSGIKNGQLHFEEYGTKQSKFLE